MDLNAIKGGVKLRRTEVHESTGAAQKEETEAVKAYEELKAAKTSEIAAGTKQIQKKTEEMAAADTKKADIYSAFLPLVSILQHDFVCFLIDLGSFLAQNTTK